MSRLQAVVYFVLTLGLLVPKQPPQSLHGFPNHNTCTAAINTSDTYIRSLEIAIALERSKPREEALVNLLLDARRRRVAWETLRMCYWYPDEPGPLDELKLVLGDEDFELRQLPHPIPPGR